MKFVTSAPHTTGTNSNDETIHMGSDSVIDCVDIDTCVMELNTILEDDVLYSVALVYICTVSFGMGLLIAYVVT